jgi:uncharacterized protein (TIGR02271 family)
MSAKNYPQDANRDPLTGEPRSHPIGTGVGAVAGGAAAGAAAGTVAGPVGTGIGAAVGAVAGGLAGKAAAEKFNPTEAGELRRFIDYTVVDREGDKIGSVDAVWQDHTNQPAYFAVRTGWLGIGKAHVVPAHRAEVNETRKTVRVPFSKEEIKNAPSFDSQDDINEDTEFTISSHYGIGRDWNRTSRFSDAPAEPQFEEGMEIDQTLDVPGGRPRETQGREETKIRLNEEQVKVGKREVEYGGVRLRKIIRTETVNVPVELEREEIQIERGPASGAPAGEATIREEDVYIPLRREEAVVEKTVSAREDVRVSKRRETARENVSEEVRSEDVEIEHKNKPRGDGPAC